MSRSIKLLSMCQVSSSASDINNEKTNTIFSQIRIEIWSLQVRFFDSIMKVQVLLKFSDLFSIIEWEKVTRVTKLTQLSWITQILFLTLLSHKVHFFVVSGPCLSFGTGSWPTCPATASTTEKSSSSSSFRSSSRRAMETTGKSVGYSVVQQD